MKKNNNMLRTSMTVKKLMTVLIFLVSLLNPLNIFAENKIEEKPQNVLGNTYVMMEENKGQMAFHENKLYIADYSNINVIPLKADGDGLDYSKMTSFEIPNRDFAHALNIDGDYVYYQSEGGDIYKLNTNTGVFKMIYEEEKIYQPDKKNFFKLHKTFVHICLYLYNGELYYCALDKDSIVRNNFGEIIEITDVAMYKMNTNGENRVKLISMPKELKYERTRFDNNYIYVTFKTTDEEKPLGDRYNYEIYRFKNDGSMFRNCDSYFYIMNNSNFLIDGDYIYYNKVRIAGFNNDLSYFRRDKNNIRLLEDEKIVEINEGYTAPSIYNGNFYYIVSIAGTGGKRILYEVNLSNQKKRIVNDEPFFQDYYIITDNWVFFGNFYMKKDGSKYYRYQN